MAGQYVIDVETDGVLLSVDLSVRYAWVVWVENEPNSLEVCTELLLPKKCCDEHSVESLHHFDVDYGFPVFLYDVILVVVW